MARLLAAESRSVFRQLSTVAAGVKELRKVLSDARRALSSLEVGVLSAGHRTVQFTRRLAEESVQRKNS